MADEIPQSLPSNQPAVAATPDDTALLDTLDKDFKRLQQQKTRATGGIEGMTLLNLAFLHDEQYTTYQARTLGLEAREANKLYLSFNLIAPRFNKLLGRLAAFNAPFKARPNKKDPQALSDAEVVDRMILALDEKLDEPSLLRETLYWMGVGGTAFRHITWIPNATIETEAQFDPATNELLYKYVGQNADETNPQILPESAVQQAIVSGATPPESWEIYEEVVTTGEVGDEVLGPLQVFIDQSVKSVRDLPPDGWVHIAKLKTVGWIKENFETEETGELTITPKKNVNIIVSRINADSGESNGGLNLKDLVPLIQGSQDAHDPDMTLLIQSYQPPSKDYPRGRYVCWIPDDQILHDSDNPFEEIPLIDIHWSPVTTSFWTKSYIAPLIAPQRFINKRMSQLGEQANATIYSIILLGAGLTEADIPADKPGPVKDGLTEEGVPKAMRLPPPEIPAWFLQSIEFAVKMFNDAAGGGDLMDDHKFPGQLRGPLAVPMLQEILDTQWGPLFSHLGERLARVKQMRLNRVKQFYPVERTMHYTGRDQRDEVLTFHTEKILRAGTNFNITVERGSLLPELRALRESRLTERLRGPLAILYMDERTGRLDKSKIAADLQFGDTGREARESQYRKLSQEIIDMIWKGKQIPPVQPFYDHAVMLDELESSMSTTEFLRASPQIQQLFAQRWQQHAQFLQQEAQRQQQAMQGQHIQTAVAQATQQAAAQAAADAIDEAREQSQIQKGLPTDQYMAAAQGRAGGQQPGEASRQDFRKKRPENEAPRGSSRKVTIEERKE